MPRCTRIVQWVLLPSLCLFALQASANALPAQQSNPPQLTLSPAPDWVSSESDISHTVVLGDVDNDGDLDVAIGNSEQAASIRIYLNQNGQLSPVASWRSPQPHRVYSLAWGDVDNDGDLDLAVGNAGEANLLYHNENGQLTPAPTWFSTEHDQTRSVAWGDIDGNSYLDLVVGNNGGAPNRIYFNQAGSLESTASWVSQSVAETVAVAVADMDNDGDLELAVGNKGAPNQLYRNTMGSLPTTPEWQAAVTDRTLALAWGDINHDGFLDLAIANNGHDFFYLNQQGILPTQPTWSSQQDDVSTTVAWGDVNGDGALDLAIGLNGPNSHTGVWANHTQIYLNDDDALPSVAAWQTSSHYVNTIALGDLDGDGSLDLVAGTDEQDLVYFSQRAPLGQTAAWSAVDTMRTRAVAWGDVNGDGQLELAVANWNQLNQIHLGQAGVAIGTTWASDDQRDSPAVAAADMNKDGYPDLAIAKNGANLIYRNDQGTLGAAPVWQSAEVDDSLGVAWADLNGDGFPELAVANDGQPNRVYLNLEGIVQPNAWWSSEDSDNTQTVLWGDVDGDGDVDLAAINRNDPIRVYFNVDGQLAPNAWISNDADTTNSMAWGDLNGDGALDLVVGNDSSSPTRVYFNDGMGHLAPTAAWNSTELSRTFSVALADVNRDGYLDLATGNSDHNHLYLSHEDSLPTSATWTSSERDRTRAIAWGDLNNDGYPELAAATQGGFQGSDGLDKVYRNQHGQLETTAFWAGGDERAESTSVAWADVNKDGFLDLVFGVEGGQPSRLYLNQSGTLSTDPVWRSPTTPDTQSVAWGDVNGDDYPDLAVGNRGGANQLYLNQDGMLQSVVAWTSTDTSNTTQIIWVDVDRDDDLDLIAANDRAANRLYLNQDGVLAADGISLGDDDRTLALALGDVDGNGSLDLAVGNRAQNRLLHNDNGLFLQRQWISDDTHAATSGVLSDYDRDSDLDLLAGTQLYPNLGRGLATQSMTLISPTENQPQGVAWGDLNGDGYPELAVANRLQPNRVYLNQQGTLAPTPLWSAAMALDTQSVDWVDINGDHKPDLVFGNNGESNQLYLNQAGTLAFAPAWLSTEEDDTQAFIGVDLDRDTFPELVAANAGQDRIYWNETGALQATASWSSSDAQPTTDLAWGDVDGDGDLDLAVATANAPNQVYENVDGQLQIDRAWRSQDADDTTGIAWGDLDQDDDLDLIVSNDHGPNKAYRNVDGLLESTPWWQSADAFRTTSLTVGDVDNDGDLDLVVGLLGRPNRLYRNRGGQLATTAEVLGTSEDDTNSVALGDVDNDGDLDLAVGNRATPNRLYLNEHGQFTEQSAWDLADNHDTRSVAWGDWDGDGDLDLAVGNYNGVNHVYRNDNGSLHAEPLWKSTEEDATYHVAWGDWDGDGDLDLAVGNDDAPNRIYENQHRAQSQQLLPSPYAIIHAPHQGAYFAATPKIFGGEQISVTYTLINPLGNSVHRIVPQYAIDGGRAWLPATPVTTTQVDSVSASPAGITHTFTWQIRADPVIQNDAIHFRLLVLPEGNHSPLLWPATATESQPFRYGADWYAKVVDQAGEPIRAATLYHAGLPYPPTTPAGLVQLPPLPTDSDLAVFVQTYEAPSLRKFHDGWAYRIYNTNLQWVDDGTPLLPKVTTQGAQLLTVAPDKTLILFNLLISIEWDATAAYMDEIAEMARLGSDYLLDLTDGQMALGAVTVVDNGQQWLDADVRIFATNRFRPYAIHGALLATPEAGGIQLGRQWDRDRGPGLWSEPDGYRTFIHEFGHYALQLYDEYFVRIFDNGNYVGREPAFCVKHRDELQRLTNQNYGSAMYWQYLTSELSATGVKDLWPSGYSDHCEYTEQWQRTKRELGLDRGESAWDTLARVFADPQQASPRWQLVTPMARGQLMAGPTALPATLPAWPTVTMTNTGTTDVPIRELTVTGPSTSFADAFVTLHRAGGRTIDQGRTSSNGTMAIYGAAVGDRLEITSSRGQYAATLVVTNDLALHVVLTPVTGNRQQVTEAADRWQPLQINQATEIHADDGLATLYLTPETDPDPSLTTKPMSPTLQLSLVSVQPITSMLMSPTFTYHSFYSLNATPAFATLNQGGRLEIEFMEALAPRQTGLAQGTLQIQWFSPLTNAWQPLPTTIDFEQNLAHAPITKLGLYALTQGTEQTEPYQLYLPEIH